MSNLAQGDKVKYSTSGLRPAWEYYLSQGEYSRKNRAKEAHAEKAAKRGTVRTVDKPGVVTIAWDDGTTSQTMDYLLERA